jgi:hypothetical protein
MSDKTDDAIKIVNAVKGVDTMSLTDIFSNTSKQTEYLHARIKKIITPNFSNEEGAKAGASNLFKAFASLIGFIISIIIYIIAYIIILCLYIILFIYNLLLRFAKLFGDYEFFNDFDGEISNYSYFLFIDVLKNKSEYDKKKNLNNNTPGNIHYEINEIFNNIKRKLQNRLEKYNSLIKSLKNERDKEEEERKYYELFQESEANKKELTFANINSSERQVLWNSMQVTAFNDIPKIIFNFFALLFSYLKLFIQILFEVLKYFLSGCFLIAKFCSKSFLSTFQQATLRWSRPFAGLMILIVLILVMVLVCYNMYAPEEELYNSNFTNIGGGSYDYKSMFNDNTSFFEALNRLPLEFYSFLNDFRMIYYELLKRLNFFMNFSSEIIDDARNFAREPEDYERTKNNTDNIYDNIYTFNAKYISDIIANKNEQDITELKNIINKLTLDKEKYVVHLIKPKDIKNCVNYSSVLGLNLSINNSPNDISWKIKCDDTSYFNNTCMIKDIDITDKETHTCSITDAIKTNKDYNNI